MLNHNFKHVFLVTLSLTLLLAVGVLSVGAFRPVYATTNTFQPCDIFTAVDSGSINWYRPNTCPGIPSSVTLQGVLTGGSSYMTGMGFDPASCESAGVTGGIPNPNPGVPCMYATDFGTGSILVYDNTGALLGTCFILGGAGSGVESVEAIEGTGGIAPGLIAGVADGVGQMDQGPLPCESSSTLTTHTASTQNRGTDWVDMSADKCTVLYTSEGSSILSFNMCTNTQNAAFATGLSSPGYALKILPDASVIVAGTSVVTHVSSSGTVINTCDSSSSGAGGLFSLDILPGGAAFATGSFNNNQIDYLTVASCDSGQATPAFSFDGTSGTGAATGSVFGVAIYGESEVVHTTSTTAQGVPEFGTGMSAILVAAIGMVGITMLMRVRKSPIQSPIP